MKSILKALGLGCALAMLGGPVALAEDMPIVVDEPLTGEEVAEAQVQQTERRREVQQILISLGYMAGEADGIFGPMTESALKDFQRAKGIPVTGELDPATDAALQEMAETVRDAEALQQRLIDLKYLRGVADGLFGARSQTALKSFQRLNGLEVTGQADAETRARLFAEDARELPARLGTGSKGDEVKALQEKLIRLGFMTGTADGRYGKATAKAVKLAQKQLKQQGYGEDVGVTQDGEASSATLALLMAPDYSSYIHDLAEDETGTEALRVERRLLDLGYSDWEPAEAFNPFTLKAVYAFQQAAGLPEGSMDKAFIDALFAEDAPTTDAYVPHDIAKGDRGLAVRAVEQALVDGGMTIRMPRGRYDDTLAAALESLHAYLVARNSPDAPLFANPEALSEEAQQVLETDLLGYVQTVPESGASKVEVMRVQRRLHTLFYLDKLDVDGDFGQASVEALKTFQETNGLPVTGVADRATQFAMFSGDALTKQLPYRVEVDIDHQQVYVYELNDAGAYEKTHTFICSTGLNEATPRGIYLDGYPVNHWHHFQEFNVWAKYSFEVEGNIMMHSVLFRQKNDNTLKENSLYALGQKASHGCIRLKVADARWIFEHCKRGTLVIVIY